MVLFLALILFVFSVIYVDFRRNFVNRKELKAYEEAYKIRKKQQEEVKKTKKLTLDNVIDSL